MKTPMNRLNRLWMMGMMNSPHWKKQFDEDSKTSFADEIKYLQEIQVYSSESPELASQYKKLRICYLKQQKAKSEEKQDLRIFH